MGSVPNSAVPTTVRTFRERRGFIRRVNEDTSGELTHSQPFLQVKVLVPGTCTRKHFSKHFVLIQLNLDGRWPTVCLILTDKSEIRDCPYLRSLLWVLHQILPKPPI